MSSWNDNNETDSDSSSEEIFEFPIPNILCLPNFLNNNYKWNKCISETKTLQQYCSLIGKITNLNIRREIKQQIMVLITSDIVIKHRNFSPHWRLLQRHALFHQTAIL